MDSQPRQFEPLLPTLPHPELAALAEEVCRRGFALKRLAHPVTEARIARLLRSVNSYYSNRIEGEQTLPRDIERALRKSFSKDPAQARLQRLALAHIETQEEMEQRLAVEPALAVFGAQFLASLHRRFYGRLQKRDRMTDAGDEVAPGYFRRRDVTVGAHEAPDWRSVPAFLHRIEEAYSAERGLAGRLIAIACAHHRLAWVHPFRDGNGRMLRLQAQGALMQHGAGSALWSVSRGFARNVRGYYARLARLGQGPGAHRLAARCAGVLFSAPLPGGGVLSDGEERDPTNRQPRSCTPIEAFGDDDALGGDGAVFY